MNDLLERLRSRAKNCLEINPRMRADFIDASNEIVQLRRALVFIHDLAVEGYRENKQTPGNEVVMRHIIRRAAEVLYHQQAKDKREAHDEKDIV